jgi:PRTRC genetic system protein A
MPIPVYVKTDPAMPRPADPEFYLLTQNGTFLCRNHPFFASDVPTTRPVRALAAHRAGVVVNYPRLKAPVLESIVGFFWRVYEMHRSEAMVLLVWDLAEKRYRLVVPEQEATVWGTGGRRSPQDVRYRVPVLPPGQLLVGDIHSHGNMPAFTSWTDAADERHRDGVHAVVGHIESDPPDFHVELAIDGERFELKTEQLFEGYRCRRKFVPRAWLERVKVRQVGWRDWFDVAPRARWEDQRP